jgi:hypothetical protein
MSVPEGAKRRVSSQTKGDSSLVLSMSKYEDFRHLTTRQRVFEFCPGIKNILTSFGAEPRGEDPCTRKEEMFQNNDSRQPSKKRKHHRARRYTTWRRFMMPMRKSLAFGVRGFL